MNTMHEELGLNRIPLRYSFVYLRTIIVPCGERPSSIPFCHYVAWQKLDNHRARVYYARCDLRGDGHKLRLRRRRSRPEETIVCAKRLSALPPRRYRHSPTRVHRRFARKVLKVHREVWHRWAAEFEPIPTWRDRWSRWFGPQKHARQIVLASETRLKWLDFYPNEYSYAKIMWCYPQVPNSVGPTAIPGVQIVGVFEIDPHRQLDLHRWTQRVVALDHRQPTDRKHFFGVHPIDDYRHCAVIDLLHPGCEVEPMDESYLKTIDDLTVVQQRKRKFLESQQN